MKMYEIVGEYYVYSVLGCDALYVSRYVCPKYTMSHYRLLLQPESIRFLDLLKQQEKMKFLEHFMLHRSI